jgi:hypothetical protein
VVQSLTARTRRAVTVLTSEPRRDIKQTTSILTTCLPETHLYVIFPSSQVAPLQ